MLKNANLLTVEAYTQKPSRNREKAMGYMWQGEMKVATTNNLQFVFFFWHHCNNDTGGNWYPSQKELDSMWCLKFVPSERSPDAKLVDACWHCIYVGDHIYVSKKGFFAFDQNNRKDQIITSIQDDTWYEDPDVWLLI